ncbi:ribonuclease H-like domain-containing protein [Halobaculum rubrum]|uniref:ribonuclease H-like domain-containing protein n=1 Tax=Halobaculum rubrum TaxID=2872158 RepID=UPI001CA39921|nr:ribonuclease H-like domain-containing protein [Halobaculum rubrum]QZY01189.1 ribonuclease H-like domain-containing protein [Halobaculum rubrum]
MQIDRDDPGHDRVATLDIETTSLEPDDGETVSVGIGIHDRDEPVDEASVEMFHRNSGDDEADVIQSAYRYLEQLDADFLVTYNGKWFDLDYLTDRLEILGVEAQRPSLFSPELHVDLMQDDRVDLARSQGKSFPSLESSLEAYGEDPPQVMWKGEPLDNTRFGEELGPTYLQAARFGETGVKADLLRTIEEYLEGDLYANFRLFYYDIGVEEP